MTKVEQREYALKRANGVRFARAALKRDLKAGADPVEVILDPPGYLENVPLDEFVSWVPYLGPVRARVLLKKVVWNPNVLIANLPKQAREHVARALREWLGVREVARAA